MSSHGGGGISDGKASSHLTPSQRHLGFRLSDCRGVGKNSLLFKPLRLWYFVAAVPPTKAEYEYNFVQIGWG